MATVWNIVHASAPHRHAGRPFFFELRLNENVDRIHRSSQFKEDEGTWKGNDDGKIVNNQPTRVMDDRNGVGPAGGYIAK